MLVKCTIYNFYYSLGIANKFVHDNNNFQTSLKDSNKITNIGNFKYAFRTIHLPPLVKSVEYIKYPGSI